MLLLQYLLAVLVIAITLGTALPVAVGVLQTTRLQATLVSLQAVARAAHDFRDTEGVWPAGTNSLQGAWLPSETSPHSAWGDPITLAPSGQSLEVSVPTPFVPSGGTSAFLTTAGGNQRLSVPPPGGQAYLELERMRVQCHPSGVIQPC